VCSSDLLRLPGREGQFKWPTLAEAYEHFSGQPLQGAHDALVDSEACLTVFRGLVETGAVGV
ncbi:MAG: 3'-5' exonuclease, partial [Myxococcota bacterium]